MSPVRWIIPEAKEPAPLLSREPSGAPASAGPRRIRLGLLDNSKDNARMLLELIAAQVCGEMDARAIMRRKGAATLPAPDETLEQLAREADCVLTAMAD